MAVGQQVLRGTLDVPALLAVEERLEQRAVDAGRVRAATLRDVLNLHSQYVASGMPLSTEPQLALLLRCSEWRAGRLLNEALLLATLPQALEALEWGILTPEQSSTVVAQLAPLSPPAQLRVWERLLARLHQTGLPPARLAELLRRWVIEADAEAAEARRKAAEDDRRVEYRRRDDGLGDLFAFGFRGPDLQAILSRINDLAAPFGPYDQRTADQRRFDALKDLLLGRAQLGAGAGASCGCRAGEAAPCGVDVQVHVPLGGALGITDEVADLASHGPVEPDLLQDLLLNSPRLTPVFVDELGVPVAMGRSVPPHERGNTAALRAALLDLATQRPPDVLHPRHPLDHRERPPDTADPPPAAARTADPPPADPPADARTGGALRRRILTERPAADERLLAAAALATGAGREHPSGQPGRYRVSRSLRRLLFARAPRCEFPGCGAKAVRCDAEHDVAWPAGPTCACNLGPCCRRHHRVKQEGWTKTRITDAGVRWTSPSGRTWSSPPQHEAPARPVRALPPLTASETPLDQLSPTQLEEELWWLAGCPDDPAGLELRAEDVEPPETDRLRERLLLGDTRWSLDLQDPYRWLDLSQPAG